MNRFETNSFDPEVMDLATIKIQEPDSATNEFQGHRLKKRLHEHLLFQEILDLLRDSVEISLTGKDGQRYYVVLMPEEDMNSFRRSQRV